MDFFPRRVKLPAQPKIQREPWSDPPVILEKRSVNGGPLAPCPTRDATLHIVRKSGHEVRLRETGVLTIEAKLTGDTGIPGVEGINALTKCLELCPHRVGTLCDNCGIFRLNHRVGKLLIDLRIAEGGGEAGGLG